MAYSEMICLAYSRKEGGCCVVGIEKETGKWLRPATGIKGMPLLPDACTLPDGTQPAVLDLIGLDLGAPCPNSHQVENVQALRSPWKLISRPAPASLMPLILSGLKRGSGIFGDKAVYLTHAAAIAKAAQGSATFINPRGIRFFWQTKFRTQLRASFYHHDDHYSLPVTDLAVERRLEHLEKGKWIHFRETGIDPGLGVFFTVTLGEPFHPTGFAEPLCYKLVSGVAIFPKNWRQ